MSVKHLLPTIRKPNISYDEYTEDKMFDKISYCLLQQLLARIKGLDARFVKVDDPSDRRHPFAFKFQYYMDKNHSTIYINYDLADDLETVGNLNCNIRERINNKIFDQLTFEMGYNVKVNVPKNYKDYRNGVYTNTYKEYIPEYCIGLWKNKTTDSIEFIQDKDIFNFYLRIAKMNYQNNYEQNNINDKKHNPPLNKPDNIHELNDPDDILTIISDKILQLNNNMKSRISEINEPNRKKEGYRTEIDNGNARLVPTEKLTGDLVSSDEIIKSIYNEYKQFMLNRYGIKLNDYLEDEIHVGMIEYDYDDSFKNIIKKNTGYYVVG